MRAGLDKATLHSSNADLDIPRKPAAWDHPVGAYFTDHKEDEL